MPSLKDLRVRIAAPTVAALLALLLSAPMQASEAPKSPDELAAKYMQYFAAKDIEAILALYSLDGVDDSTKAFIKSDTEGGFARLITSYIVRPAQDRTKKLEYSREGVIYHIDPSLVGEIKFSATYPKVPELKDASFAIPYGQKNKSYFFVTTVPKAR